MATNPSATIDTANGMAKDINGTLQSLVPDKNNKFTRRFKLDKDKLCGAQYKEPVFLTGEHGATATGNSGAKQELNGSEVATTKEASVNPCNLWMQTSVVIDSLKRMNEEGPKSFANYLTKMMAMTRIGLDKRLELNHLFGTYPLATLSSATDSVTTSLFTITAASWAPHIWLNMKGCPIDAYDSSTKLNTTAELVITKVNPADFQITVTGAAADIDAIMAIGTNGSGVTLYLRGFYGNVGNGVRNVCKLSSGTFEGISADDYNDVWCATQTTWSAYSGQTKDVPFTWTILQQIIEEMVSRGSGRDLIAQVPFPVWTTLNSSLDALRVLDDSYSVSNQKMGHKEDAITYETLGVHVTIEPSGFQPYGEVWLYPKMNDGDDALKIIGSTPITFEGADGKEMFYQVQGANGRVTNAVEWCAMTCQSVFTTCPRDFGFAGA